MGGLPLNTYFPKRIDDAFKEFAPFLDNTLINPADPEHTDDMLQPEFILALRHGMVGLSTRCIAIQKNLNQPGNESNPHLEQVREICAASLDTLSNLISVEFILGDHLLRSYDPEDERYLDLIDDEDKNLYFKVFDLQEHFISNFTAFLKVIEANL